MEIAFFWQMAASWSKIQERKPHLKLNFIIRTTWTYQAYCPKWAVLFQFFLWKRFMEIAFFWQKAASWSKIPKRRPHLKFYYQVNINLPTHETISEACQWHQFDMAQIGPKLALIAPDGLKNENFWKISVKGCYFGHLEWKNGLAMIVNDIIVIWPKLAKIGFYHTRWAPKWIFIVQGC